MSWWPTTSLLGVGRLCVCTVTYCVMCDVLLVEGGPTPSLPSLSDISNMGTSTDMSLIASTMRRVLYLAASKMKDVYQLGQQKLAVLFEKNINNEKDGTIDEAATAFTVPEISVATTNNNSK